MVGLQQFRACATQRMYGFVYITLLLYKFAVKLSRAGSSVSQQKGGVDHTHFRSALTDTHVLPGALTVCYIYAQNALVK